MRISDWSSDVCSSDLRHPRDLAQHTLLHSDSVHLEVNSMGRWEVWLALLHVTGVNAQAGPTYPSSYMLLEAAIHGQGVALTWAALAAEDLRAGRLGRPFDRQLEGSTIGGAWGRGMGP